MQPEYEIITQEIPSKGKGYLEIRHCVPELLGTVLRQGAAELVKRGAFQIYAACTDIRAPLYAGEWDGFRLVHVHDMLGMYCDLVPERPRATGRLSLLPLTRERGGRFLALYNESFYAVPNSVTYGAGELEQLLTGQYRCGFALLDGVAVGIYETGFKKTYPEIGSLGLTEAVRGKGLGRELLLTVMDELAGLGCQKCWLQVSTANQSAYPLYQSAGFYLDRVLSSWYEIQAEGDLCG